jgi:polysaccharide export outer membrane protein
MPSKLLSGCIAISVSLWAGLAAQGQVAAQRLRIGSGDVISVHVFREPNLDSTLRVLDSGQIALPLIGNVAVSGLSTAQAASDIGALYQEEGYLNQPQVQVSIDESAAQEVAVLGEVGHPGTVKVSSPRNVLDVLAEAGGLLKDADRHVTIRRMGSANVTVMVTNDPEQSLALTRVLVYPGDTLIVPRAGIVYVLGDVGHPGGYLMQNDAQLTLMQALALASGTSRTAADGGARLIRKVQGRTVEIPLHLKAVERGSMPDLALQDKDILYVPFSFAKNLAIGAPSIAASASSAIIYAAY